MISLTGWAERAYTDPEGYLHALLDPMMHSTASASDRLKYRKDVTKRDPLAFALIYLAEHLRDAEGRITLSEVHRAWAEHAGEWAKPASTEPAADRVAEIAPRESGKSTWHFLILPMWGAAHGHIKFAAAFADTGTQAETHLATFKSELDTNVMLGEDYPELVKPKTRGRGTVEADRVSLYHARSSFVFAAAGMDSSNLGLKVGAQRPDLIILDDIEPHEGRYSADQAKKRLDTLLSAILPLNIYARVLIVGTVTMSGSIIHQLVKVANKQTITKDLEWVGENKITPHYYGAIATNDDGTRRSIWPSKWSLEYLESIEHTRTYAKNYANDPLGADGDYWRLEDFTRQDDLPGVTRVVLSVDPAVTQKASSDYTGLAVVAWSPSAGPKGKCIVLHAAQVKQDPETLRLSCLALVTEYDVGLVLVETNQGGDLWHKILWGFEPIKVKAIVQSVKKEVRAAGVLVHYQRGHVVHVPGLTDAEGQMVAFPNAPHDDMVDAIGTGVAYFLSRPPKVKVGGSIAGYDA